MSARHALDRALTALGTLHDEAVFISQCDPGWLSGLADRIDAAPAHEVPLRGLTFAVKDNIDVAGLATTAACPGFARTAARDGAVVARLVAQGALPIGKTNLDQFATGLVGVRSPYGIPRNPFDPDLIPGGSSSGSAVAVARGVVDFALGTDTAGSGRVPAAMCGIIGCKPTRGWLSTSGVVPAVRSIDCVSVFATGLDTAWAAVVAAAGFDPDDVMSRPAPPTSRARADRVGVLARSTLENLGVDPGIIDAYTAWCDRAAARGCTLVEADPSVLLEIGRMLYGGPWVAERHAAVGEEIEAGVEGLDPTVAAIIGGARRFSATDAHRAAYRLAALRRDADAVFDACDVLATPTIPTVPTIAAVTAEPVALNERMGLFTTFTNLADLCALSLPAGPGPGRSVTLHGPAWADETLVHLARRLGGDGDPAGLAEVPRGWVPCAVAGAHLRGQPLEHQMTERGALWLGTTTTATGYRLFALSGTVPPKPGLVRAAGGVAIEVDVWALPPDGFGTFVASIPPPLGIGTVELADGASVPGFICESAALDGAREITSFGGWRAYRAAPA